MKFEEKFIARCHMEIAELRELDGYKNNPTIDNSDLKSNKYWICGVIHGIRLSISLYKILKRRK